MQEHLTRALTFLRGGFGFLWKALKELWIWAKGNKKYSIPLAIALVLAIGGLGFFLNMTSPGEEVDGRREVILVSVGDVSTGEPITVIGEIRSVSEADVAPDSSGRVTHVYRSIGDYVSAGAVIAEIENTSQKAALAQAEAALQSAKSGAAISGISVESAVAGGETARQNAYNAIANAITGSADAAFSNPESSQPLLFVASANSQLKNTVEAGRLAVGAILKRHAALRTQALSETELLDELNRLSKEIDQVREFLSNLASVLSGGIATGSVTEAEIDALEASARAALSSVTAIQSGVTSAASGIKSAKEGVSQGSSGETAGVALAQAGLDSARAALEKTIVRAPIAGTINSITLEEGNFAGAGAPAVRIVNVSGLEAVAYLSERDLPRIQSGSSARISGIANGRVSRVAPALDPQTRKGEVRITILGVDEGENRFVSGQSATIELSPTRTKNETAIFIPISSVKITPDGAVVFIVTKDEANPESGILVSLPITIAALSGGKIEVTSGLTLENTIVLDARGLKEGQDIIIGE